MSQDQGSNLELDPGCILNWGKNFQSWGRVNNLRRTLKEKKNDTHRSGEMQHDF